MIRQRPQSQRLQGQPRQRGVALIIALVLVALATILATKITFDGYLERQRTIGILGAEQALHFSLGAEALAADGLMQSVQQGGKQGAQVTLADAWAQPIPPFPITPPNDAEGEPIGTVEGTLEDLQGRFNLNNLGRMVRNATTQKFEPDPVPFAQFEQLLVSLGLETKWAQMARDWIDPDSLPGGPDGAEDSVYTALDPPYLTANFPMLSPTELMNLPGFGLERYRKIAPYVTALPISTKLNVCTAPVYVLESLTKDLHGNFSTSPKVLTANRKNGCFPDIKTLQNMMPPADFAQIQSQIAESSDFFRLTTHVTLGTTQFTLYSLLQRGTGGKITPLLRSFGTL